MSYESFQTAVSNLVKKAGGGISARFVNEDGKYIAHLSDGTRIIGNAVSPKVTVRWNGRNHQSVVRIA